MLVRYTGGHRGEGVQLKTGVMGAHWGYVCACVFCQSVFCQPKITLGEEDRVSYSDRTELCAAKRAILCISELCASKRAVCVCSVRELSVLDTARRVCRSSFVQTKASSLRPNTPKGAETSFFAHAPTLNQSQQLF